VVGGDEPRHWPVPEEGEGEKKKKKKEFKNSKNI